MIYYAGCALCLFGLTIAIIDFLESKLPQACYSWWKSIPSDVNKVLGSWFRKQECVLWNVIKRSKQYWQSMSGWYNRYDSHAVLNDAKDETISRSIVSESRVVTAIWNGNDNLSDYKAKKGTKKCSWLNDTCLHRSIPRRIMMIVAIRKYPINQTLKQHLFKHLYTQRWSAHPITPTNQVSSVLSAQRTLHSVTSSSLNSPFQAPSSK